MKKEYRIVLIIIAVIVLALIAWEVLSRKSVEVTQETKTSIETGTTSTPASIPIPLPTDKPASGTKTPSASITEVKFGTTDPNSKVYYDSRYKFAFLYPINLPGNKSASIIPTSPEKTPLVYRAYEEFAYCIPAFKTPQGCAPAVTLGLADGSGHGVSVYILDNAAVQAIWTQPLPYVFIDKNTGYRYEVYFSDTVTAQATPEQNKARQDLMAFVIREFTIVR